MNEVYTSLMVSFDAKGKKGLFELSINYVKVGESPSEPTTTASECIIESFIKFS